MTEREIKVQKEETELIKICDHCGLSDDQQTIHTFTNGQHKLDLHKDCIPTIDENTIEDNEPLLKDLSKIAAKKHDNYTVSVLFVIGKWMLYL